MRCPLCGGGDLRDVVSREALPLMQNVVYASRAEALAAPVGAFVLALCASCGFAFNRRFEAARMVYDARYDNEVPSPTFERYYREIALALSERYRIPGGVVVDVGCGKGRFLEVLTATVRGGRGVGVDPSCRPRTATTEAPVELIADVFRAEHVPADARLVSCRHTLEHVADPVSFLREINVGLAASAASAPVFIEVPDLDWILDHGAFWDLCYEHCNYFTAETLKACLARAGFAVEAVVSGFGGQYLWAYARLGAAWVRDADAAVAIARAERFAAVEGAKVAPVRAAAEGAALWGMATKGVIFALLVDPEGTNLAGGVDINVAKQGSFAPVSGLAIHPPEWLRSRRGAKVFVMNPNYLAEISALCAALGIDAPLVPV